MVYFFCESFVSLKVAKKNFSWKSLSRLLGVIQLFTQPHNLEWKCIKVWKTKWESVCVYVREKEWKSEAEERDGKERWVLQIWPQSKKLVSACTMNGGEDGSKFRNPHKSEAAAGLAAACRACKFLNAVSFKAGRG